MVWVLLIFSRLQTSSKLFATIPRVVKYMGFIYFLMYGTKEVRDMAGVLQLSTTTKEGKSHTHTQTHKLITPSEPGRHVFGEDHSSGKHQVA